MSKINRVPFGFLNVLDSQNFGKNPSDLEEKVRAIVDMYPFYSLDANLVAFASRNWAAVGETSSVAVPEGEVWEIVNLQCRASSNAASTGYARWILSADIPRQDGTGVARSTYAEGPLNLTVLDTVSIARTFGVSWQPPTRMLVRPGTVFVAQCSDIALGGAPSFVGSILVQYRRWIVR